MRRNDIVLLIQERVYDEIIPKYTFHNYKSNYFRIQSYISWATDELITFIDNWDLDDASEAIDQFIYNMRLYSTLDTTNTRMFDIALELATDIKDVIRAMD